MKPPTEVEPSALFLALSQAERPSEVVDFPRRGPTGAPVSRIRIQVLTSRDHDEARFKAHETLRKRGIDKEDMSSPAIKEVLGDAVAKELIAMACLTEGRFGDAEPPVYARVFRDARDVEVLRADEILVLFNAYMLVQNKYGPFERNLVSKEDVDAWILRLGEGAAEFPLLELPSPQLVRLALLLAERLYSLSLTLESQPASSPSTLASVLATYCLGTISAGEPADEPTATTSERRDRPLTPITIETATELAEKMRMRG